MFSWSFFILVVVVGVLVARGGYGYSGMVVWGGVTMVVVASPYVSGSGSSIL